MEWTVSQFYSKELYDFVALNLPLLKNSSALPVFTTSAFLLNGTLYHFYFLFCTCKPPRLS